jgi:hypothetical protein
MHDDNGSLVRLVDICRYELMRYAPYAMIDAISIGIGE